MEKRMMKLTYFAPHPPASRVPPSPIGRGYLTSPRGEVVTPKRQRRRTGEGLKALLIALCILLFPAPSHAEDEEGYTWSPEHCDFRVVFPEQPYETRKCSEEKPQCHKVTSFTQVYDMHTTINFRVTCNPSPEGALERYSGETLKTVLKGMIDEHTVPEYELHFMENEGAKIASLTGSGITGRTPMIYTAQIWVGSQSVFTLEGELIGKGNEKSDNLFAEIISSIEIKKQKEDENPPQKD
jgi:hypothetical protein